MGKGIDLARIDNPEHAAVIDDMKDQLIIALFKRLGGTLDIPVAEVDATAHDLLAMSVDVEKRMFHFEVLKKS